METLTLLHIEKYLPFIKQLSELLREKFTDKLQNCYVYNASFIFSKILSIVTLFIDKKTQLKIKLINE